MSGSISSVAADTRRPGRIRSSAVAAALLACALAAACSSRATRTTPTETWFVDKHDRVYEMCLMIVHDLGGEVVTESRFTRVITARFPEEVFGHGVYLDVRVERREDESWVRAETRPESAAVAKEDLDALRARFFDALHDLWQQGTEGVDLNAPRPPETDPGRPPR
jgi:hypothetical protein